MRTFISFFVLFFLSFGYAQDTTYIDVDSSYFQSSKISNELVLNKPLSKKMIYVLRFTDIPEPNFSLRDSVYKLQLNEEVQKNTSVYKFDEIRTHYIRSNDSISKKDNILQLAFEIPETRLKISDEIVLLSHGLARNYEYTRLYSIHVRITYEQPDFYSVKQWENGKNADTEVLNVIEEKDHHKVYIPNADMSETHAYKVRINPHDKLDLDEKKGYLDIINIPYKIRSIPGIGATSAFNLNNLGFSFGFNFREWVVLSNNYRMVQKSFGPSVFILPSLQRVNYIGEIQSQYVETFRATFLGIGLSINYCVNGISFHFIPFAFDFQMSAEANFIASHSDTVFTGFGIGYRPFKARY